MLLWSVLKDTGLAHFLVLLTLASATPRHEVKQTSEKYAIGKVQSVLILSTSDCPRPYVHLDEAGRGAFHIW